MKMQPLTTFLLCIESGVLEGQTLLAIECLRRFGGAMSSSPVLVVTPRRGPSLARHTLHKLSELGATYARRDLQNRWDWFTYMNKGSAALLGDELAQTEQVIWLDSDVLVVSAPEQLLLQLNEDFACGAINKNVGSSGPGDPHEPYWQAMAEAYGLPIDSLPWVTTQRDNQVVRFRLHSGVYSFRRGLGLGKRFTTDLETMLASNVAFTRGLPQPGDDVALAFSVVQLKLRWRNLSHYCNYQMTPSSSSYKRIEAPEAKVLHYHHALNSPEGSSWFLRELESFRPDVAEWLRPRVPLQARSGGLRHLIQRRFLRSIRSMRQRKHEAECRFMVPD